MTVFKDKLFEFFDCHLFIALAIFKICIIIIGKHPPPPHQQQKKKKKKKKKKIEIKTETASRQVVCSSSISTKSYFESKSNILAKL